MIEISVIVPTFNRKAVLERTLPMLLQQNFPAAAYEVVVIVDGSTDGSEEMLRSLKPACGFQVLRTPQLGASAARNAGIRAASGDLVLFLDDDLLCGPDLLAQHRAAHTASEARVVHGPIYVAANSSRSLMRYITEHFYEEYYRPLDPQMELRYPDDIRSSVSVLSSLVNSSMPRQTLLECGGFDEAIRAAEDLELGLRLWKCGCVFRYLPQAEAHEFYVKTSSDFLRRQAKALGAGDLRASRKHPEYRPCSSLAGMAEIRLHKRTLLEAYTRSPVSPVPLFAWPLRFERWMYAAPALRKFGISLLLRAERITRLRSAAVAAGGWANLEAEFGRRCPALLYHHVGPLHPGTYRSLNVSAEQFEQQVRWLARRGYTGIRPSDWLRWLRHGTGLPKKPILITFDDGYADIAEYALPVLRRYGFPAAVYLVTGQLGGTNTWDEAQGSATLRLMTAEHIRYWASQGIEFGAHSRTHANLPDLTEEECSEEIAGSRRDLAALLGVDPVSFAYPFGEYSDPVLDQVRSEFALGFSIIEGMNYLRGDPHLLRRIYVGPDHSLAEFALAVHRGKNAHWFRDLRVRLAVRTRIRRALGGKPSTSRP